tara:strand:+ start:73 stop:888 length:816 start_codon:yes stop_codon:yes gene_type:complete
MSLVETNWLLENLDNVKILDCSWHLPSSKREAYKEYLEEHIPNTIFFDLDKNSDLETDLPHMLPKKEVWENNLSSIGINNKDRIIIYDNSDLISSCRCWYNFLYFGHKPDMVSVLNGGLKKWKNEKKKVTKNIMNINKSNYIAQEKKNLVKSKKQIDENIIEKEFIVIDARSRDRFNGLVSEPRKNVKSGSIQNSVCLPFTELINEDKTFKNVDEILIKFNKAIGNDNFKKIVFSCGSGVTAAVLALAYSLINNKYIPSIYDGSWAEYGKV